MRLHAGENRSGFGPVMTKRKSHKKGEKHSDTIALITYTVIALIILIVAVGAGYYFGYSDAKSDAQQKYAAERKASEELVERLRKAAVSPTTTQQLQSVLQRDRGKYAETAQHEYGDTPKALPPVGPKRTPKLSTELPKLAIIIDDVAFAGDVRRIKALQMPLTMSFLPPSIRHPDSAKLRVLWPPVSPNRGGAADAPDHVLSAAEHTPPRFGETEGSLAASFAESGWRCRCP